MSPSRTGAGSLTLSHPKLADMFWEMSVTLCPVTSASVKVESTSGLPNSVCVAQLWSKWTGIQFSKYRTRQPAISHHIVEGGCRSFAVRENMRTAKRLFLLDPSTKPFYRASDVRPSIPMHIYSPLQDVVMPSGCQGIR